MSPNEKIVLMLSLNFELLVKSISFNVFEGDVKKLNKSCLAGLNSQLPAMLDDTEKIIPIHYRKKNFKNMLGKLITICPV